VPLKPSLARFVLGAAGDGRLPERVRESVRRHQQQGEVLIGWVQLGVVMLFGGLYLLAPKTSAGTDFMPVPYALAAYLAFTVIRLWLAARGRLGPVLLVASVLADMGLLMGLIWSFHLQYDQSAAFYLKAPTLLYVFIFIALRALNYQSAMVVVAGLVAALGWAGLLAYALVPDMMGGGDPVTRDYIAYMTSNRVLIGAEVDKIVSILTVTAILAIALARGRRLLERAVADSLAARDLALFVAPEAARRITQSGEALRPGDGEVREGTIVFTDIEGFTTLSETLDPATLMGVLNGYFAAATEIVARHGGVVIQFIGDALMISFGGQACPDHAGRAVACARALVEELNDRPFGAGSHRLRTRCGLNTGPVIMGAVGAQDRLVFTAHGDCVNVAARLEQLNKHFGRFILMSEQTVASADAWDDVEPVGEIAVRGRQQPTRVFGLRADAPASTRERAALPSGAAPPYAMADPPKMESDPHEP
jgi:adenylate cyclase